MAVEDNQSAPTFYGDSHAGLASSQSQSQPRPPQQHPPPPPTFFGGEDQVSDSQRIGAASTVTAARTFKVSQAHLQQPQSAKVSASGAGAVQPTQGTVSVPSTLNPNPNPAAWFAHNAPTGPATNSAGEFFGSLSAADMATPSGDHDGLDDRLSTVSASLSTLDVGATNACPRCRRATDFGTHFCNRCGYQLGSLDAPFTNRDVANAFHTGTPTGFEAYSGETSFVDAHLGEPSVPNIPVTSVLNETPPRHMFHQAMASGECGGEEIPAASYETGQSAERQPHYTGSTMSNLPLVVSHSRQFEPVVPAQASLTFAQTAASSSGHPPLGMGGIPLMRSGTIDSFASSTAIHQMNRPTPGSGGPLTSFALAPSSRSTAPVPSMMSASTRSRVPLIQTVSSSIDEGGQFPPTAMAATAIPPFGNAAPLSAPTLANPASVPAAKSTRVHPVFCFGFGGFVFVSFPIKQMRFTMTPTGVSPSSGSGTTTGVAYHRPGPLHRVPLATLPRIREICIDPILQCADGQPLTSQRQIKVKELVATLDTLLPTKTNDPQGRDVLIRLLQLMLTNKEGMGMGEARDEAIRRLLLPDEQRLSLDPIGSPAQPTPTITPSPRVHAELTKLLLRGDRGNAVMLAVSQHMWPHALLIASHVDRETYCATVGEFARQVLPLGHPLRTMYLLFAEQHALAGAEMQSMGSPILRRDWLIQLAMIMSNHTPDDYLTTMALGDALRQEGLVYAAHLCYLLCDDANLIAGPEMDSTRIVYLGTDHERAPSSFACNWPALRLTEILEFALCQASGGHYVMGHLQTYKLKFAGWLADLGLSSLAVQYCRAIEEVVRLAAISKSPSSPYLRDPALGATTKSLHERLVRHLGMTTSGDLGVGGGSGSGGWLPKMGGILEAFDRGLTRVIGVTAEEGGVGTHPEGTINVMAANEQEQRQLPATNEPSLVAVPESVPMYSMGSDGRQWPQVQPPQQQQVQSMPSFMATSHEDPQSASLMPNKQEGEGYSQEPSSRYQPFTGQQWGPYYQGAGSLPMASTGPTSETMPLPQEQMRPWQQPGPGYLSAPTHPSAPSAAMQFPELGQAPPSHPQQQPEAWLQPRQPMQAPQYAHMEQPQSFSGPPPHSYQPMQVMGTMPSASSPPLQHQQPSQPYAPPPLPSLSPDQPQMGGVRSSPSVPSPSMPQSMPSPKLTQTRAASQPPLAPPSQSPPSIVHSQGSTGQWTGTAPEPAAAFPPVPSGTVATRMNEEEDDLGFGNLSLSKGAKSVDGAKSERELSAAGGETETSAVPPSTTGTTVGEKKGVLGFITGWFGRKATNEQASAGGPKQASLGEPSSFRYDERLKRWVDDKDLSTFEPVALPPPPLAKMKVAAAPPSGEEAPGSARPAIAGSPGDFRRGTSRSARSRYVDPFNPQAGEDSGSTPAPTVSTPVIPLPGQFVASQSHAQTSQAQEPPQSFEYQPSLQQNPPPSQVQDQPLPSQQSQWQGTHHAPPQQQPQQMPTTEQTQYYTQQHPQAYYQGPVDYQQQFHASPYHQQPPQEYQQPAYYYQADAGMPSQASQAQYTYGQ